MNQCKQYWLFNRHVQIHSNCIDYIRKCIYESMRKVLTIIYLHFFLYNRYCCHGVVHICIKESSLIVALIYVHICRNLCETRVRWPHDPPRSIKPSTVKPPLPSHHPTHLRSCWARQLVKWLGRLSRRFREIPRRFQPRALAFGASAGTTFISSPEKIIPESSRVLNGS